MVKNLIHKNYTKQKDIEKMWNNTLTETVIIRNLKNQNQASYQIEY